MPPRTRHLVRLASPLAFPLVAALATAHPLGAQLRSGFREIVAPRGDDTITPFADFGFDANVNGTVVTSASACMNGYLSLGIVFEPAFCIYEGQTPALGTLSDFSAIFGTAVVGAYRDLNAVPTASGRLGYGRGTVGGNQAFGFTWHGVFSFGTTTRSFFQLLFIDRSSEFGAGAFDLEYNYGALAASGGVGGVADDGGFSGTPLAAAVTPAANTRTRQCFRDGVIDLQGCVAQNVVPEPSTGTLTTVALTVTGLGALAGMGRRRAA